MLDALVAEARVRWGLDPVGGLQVVAVERLIATPLDPSLPLILVPAALLGGGPSGEETQAALPGRHGPRGHRLRFRREDLDAYAQRGH